MSYIGNPPLTGSYKKLDDISSGFNGSTTTFNLTSSTTAVTPGSPNALIISLGGVVQEPTSSYTVSGSTITFTTAPAASTTFWGVMLGDTLYVGVSQGTVTPSMLSTGGPYWDTSGNVGVGTSSPTSYGSPLTVYAATNPSIAIASGNANAYLRLYSTSDNNMYLTNTGGSMTMLTASTERMRIDAFGRVGIGLAATSNAKLQVKSALDQNLIVGPSISLANSVSLSATNDAASANIPLEIRYATQTTFYDSGTARLTIDSTGDVGINTTTPAYLLDVVPPSATATNGAIVGNTSRAAGVGTDYRNGWFLRRRDGTSPTSYGIWTSSDTTGSNYWENMILGALGGGASIVFQTGSASLSEAMRISNAGNVGIGTSSPATKLSFPNNVQVSWQNSSGTFTAGSAGTWLVNGSDNNFYVDNFQGATVFRRASYAESMRIDSSGNLGVGVTPTAGYGVIQYTGNGSYLTKSDGTSSLASYNSETYLISNATLSSAGVWTARSTTASTISGRSSAIVFTTDSGLTSGNAFSPTERFRITSTGAISVGSSGTATGTSGQVLTSSGSGSAPTWTTISTSIATAPTTTVYTTGSGTYTTPANVKYLHIRMVGGGAGAGGQAGSTGTGGGNTTFGSAFLTAGGGSAPAANAGGASGGTATGGDINIPGGGGGPRCFAAPQVGSPGGHSMLGNGGQFGEANGGGGYSGTGYGAGGGSYGPSSGQNSGGGGGAGGYVEKIVSSPAASYSYAVGAGGSAGTNSGQGTGGIIIIQEYYNY